MKNNKNKFRNLLMLAPAAVMLLSSGVYSQEKDLTSSKRGPSVIESSIELDKTTVAIDNTYVDIKHPIGPDFQQRNIAQVDGDEFIVTEVAETEVEKLKAQLAQREKEVADLKVSIEEESIKTTEEIESLKMIAGSAEREIQTLQASIEALEIQSEAITLEKTNLETKVTDLSIELTSLKEKLNEQELKITKLEEEKAALEKEKAELEASKLVLEEEKEALQEEKDELHIVACKQEDRLQNLEQQVSQSANMPGIMQTMMMMQQQNMMMMMQMMNSNSYFPSLTNSTSGTSDMGMMMYMQSMQQGMQQSLFQNNIYSLLGSQNNMRPQYQIGGDYINGNPYSTTNFGQQPQAQNMNTQSMIGMNSPYNYNMGRMTDSSDALMSFGNMTTSSTVTDPGLIDASTGGSNDTNTPTDFSQEELDSMDDLSES